MSFSGGQLIGAVVGLAVGFVTFNPALGASIYSAMSVGASIGMTIGGIIDPPGAGVIKQEGPRLGDLTVQTSEWGRPISRLFGTYRMTGNVIWAIDLIETKHVNESGEGKGGGGTQTETTWYSYAGSWAVGFCEGEIAGIKKIWFDAVLVYDGTNYSGGLNTSNHTIYPGSATQEIDWYMQSINADTPAYRHLCYILFNNIQLENYGNKIPKVSCEISKVGTDVAGITRITPIGYEESRISTITTGYTQPIEGSIITYNDIYGYYYFYVRENSLSGSSKEGYYTLGKFDLFGNLVKFTEYDSTFGGIASQSTHFRQGDGIIVGIGNNNTSYVATLFNRDLNFVQNWSMDTSSDPEWFAPEFAAYTDNILFISAKDKNNGIYKNFNYIWASYLHTAGSTDPRLAKIIDGSDLIDIYPNYGFVANNSKLYFFSNPASAATGKEYTIRVFNTQGIFLEDIDLTSITNVAQWFQSTALLIVKNDILYALSDTLSSNNYYLEYDLFTRSEITNNTISTSGLWTGSYSGGIVTDTAVYMVSELYGTIKYNTSFSSSQVSIASITQELLDRAGLENTDYDVTEGTDLVNGYVIANKMQTRPAVTSLTSAFNFDLIESNSKIKLKKRTNIISDTVTDVLDFVQIERLQTVELSKSINILYANKDKNYDIGSQISSRIDANTKNVKTYQYAIALSDTQAKKISETYLYSEWNERLKFEFSTSSKYIDLEPSDVIAVISDNFTFIVRITDLTIATNKQLDIKAVLEDYTVYESTAVGSSTNNTTTQTSVVVTGDTNFELLDIPMLDNAYDQEGIYVAVDGYLTTWPGSSVAKSTDLETTYNGIGQTTSGTLLGQATTALTTGNTHIWDNNSVTILVISGSVFSISQESVLSGDNYILLGDEILQYQLATDNLDGTFTLSKLLRGRRGTEWAVGTHTIGERFVFLDTDMLFDSTATSILTYYKAITLGAFIEDSNSKSITPEIRCLKPLSPSYIKGVRDGSNNLTITWMRRSRDVTGYLKTLQLLESTESYEVVIVDADVATSYFVSTEEFIYSNAAQLADISTHSSGDPVKIIVYQISSIVVRGYGTQETV